MWKVVKGKLVQTTDTSRVKFRTNISKSLIEELNQIAEENGTHTNYLLETGLTKVLKQDSIDFDKQTRPKDRVQYKTTYDKELIENVKEFAKKHQYNVNDVIEYSAKFIDIENSKDHSYRYRVE
ncbi:rRNA methyltransferase [Aquibacillus sediminis]|uniref:rRNA methyltransferase n=1 Tax=Aquibacillus sediminis TaxID=2574734 RepID=UPI0011093FF7|nr:rRNA methyltransferase [Aquibacillus sediminis]